jgi:hypothetical protein
MLLTISYRFTYTQWCPLTEAAISDTCFYLSSLLIKLKLSHCGAWGEWRYSSYSFSTSALDGGEWSASRPVRALHPGKGPPVPIWTGGRVGPRVGLDIEVRGKILCFCRGSNLDRLVVQLVVRHYTD